MKTLALIALVVGCSTQPTDFVAPDAQPPTSFDESRSTTLILGQSNAEGVGKIEEVDPSWAEPFPEVTLSRYGLFGPESVRPLQPHGIRFGAELSLGREMPTRDIAICAQSGTSLAEQWDPDGAWPSVDANLYTQCVTWARPMPVTSILWFQGETDAKDAEMAAAYDDNLRELFERLLAEFPCATVFYYRLAISSGYVEVMRAAQEANDGPLTKMVDIDAVSLAGLHFTGEGYLELGRVFAREIRETPARCAP